MAKKIGILFIVACLCVALFFYNKLNSQLTRITPESIALLQETVAAENESAISKPSILAPTKMDLGASLLQQAPPNPINNLYYGDLHVHSSWSFDASLSGNQLGPKEAYQFARGKKLHLRSGEIAQLSVPLDFAAVTDHAEGFGIFEGCADPQITPKQIEFCALFEDPSLSTFLMLRKEGTSRPPVRNSFCGEGGQFCIKHGKTTWQRTQSAASDAYAPGVFTTFNAYEYSPAWPKGGSTHRNVIFRNNEVPELVVSAYDASTAPTLWRMLEETCSGDCQFLTIPHNLNRYYGRAFSQQDEDGADYKVEDWKRRNQYEPLLEIYQAKGNSECALGVGTTDEECNFEQFFSPCEDGESIACAGEKSFARDGLKLGLALKNELGFNPLKNGFIGSTDTHNSTPGDTEEWDFRGKSGVKDASAAMRLKKKKFGPATPLTHNPGGLAAIWAEENTRDALFDALLRKETFATSGTRIKLRFFAGFDFDADLKDDPLFVTKAYQVGVPMGGTLKVDKKNQEKNTPLKLLVWAVKDPNNADLDRIQVIKGWIEDGEQKELVQDIACGGGRKPQPDTGRCPASEALVDLSTCQVSQGDGNKELWSLWEDKHFDPNIPSFYYMRVLQNPTCRWSTFDAIRLSESHVDELSPTIQERAWSSPIWYSPDAE
jgi:hypothetical protein